jgi:UPF0755 protein
MTTAPEATPPPAAGRSCLRIALRVAVYLLLALAAILLLSGAAAYLAYDYVTRDGVPQEPVDLTVPAGATGQDVGRLLAEEGLIEHELFFRAAVRLDARTSPGGSIKFGPYRLHRGLSPLQLLHLLYEGPNRPLSPEELPLDQRITVPEGLTVAQMAGLFDDPDAFLACAARPELLARIHPDAPTLEGFLMPNTYYFFDGKPSEEQVVERMVEQFSKEYAALVAAHPEAAERDLIDVVTVASLVEEEARVDEERPLVASVIYNRLDRGMPLQLDSTLQFALGKYGERLLYRDKEVESPYNTYKHAGLPPGPISNPGVASLRAALNPAASDYLYFVSNADGKTHTFSKNEREHVEAVQRYRRDVAEQRKALQGQ